MNRIALTLAGLASGLALVTGTQAASLQFTATIVDVAIDTGAGQLAGTLAGAGFTAIFGYPNVAGPPDFEVVDEANYALTGSASLTRTGGPTVSGTAISVNIINDAPLDPDAADLINTLVMPAPPAVANQSHDVWTVQALQTGAFETDTTPGDLDDTETLFNGVGFEIALLSLDDSLFDSLAYRPLPPGYGDVPVRALLIVEADAEGGRVFEAIGLISEPYVVPAPGALWLLGTGLVATGWHRRRAQARRNATGNR